MNFLAHIFLSRKDEDLLLGNFMADFITNRQIQDFSPRIIKGIELHRIIDTYTDNHVMVRRGTKRLRKLHGKYAPVVIDILYDSVLARNWHLYTEESLEEFAQNTYLTLFRRLDSLPEKLKKRVPLMVADNFLLKYRTDAGLSRALSSMDRRTKFPSDFNSAALQLASEYQLFSDEFNVFFPDLLEVSNRFIDSIE